MAAELLETLDINITAALGKPIAQLPIGSAFFEAEELRERLRPPIMGSQSLQVDLASGGLVAAQQFESMRSQKIVSVNPTRLIVHDHSDNRDPTVRDLPETLHAVATLLGLKEVQAIVTNYEMTIQVDRDTAAAKWIAEHVFRRKYDFLPSALTPRGGFAHLHLTSDDGMQYELSMEPRLRDWKSTVLWMNYAAILETLDLPAVDKLKELIAANYQLVRHVSQALFGDTW